MSILALSECSLAEAVHAARKDGENRIRWAAIGPRQFIPVTSYASGTKKRWQRALESECECGQDEIEFSYVHSARCPMIGARRVPNEVIAGLVLPRGLKAEPKPRKERKHRKPPDYRFTLQFQFTRPINLALWKKIKAPIGWKKNPTCKEKQNTFRAVRFRCTDLKYVLTPEQISLLHMQLIMCLETGVF